MTAQIDDTFYYQNKKYDLVAMTEGELFEPEKHGFHPVGWTTACWRGYYNSYRINKDGLFLSKVTIFSDQYPEFDGVKPEPEKGEYDFYLKDKRPEYKDRPYPGPFCYNKLHYRINYTGKIVMGRDFIREYYIHMGFQRPWAYETVKEFEFEDGFLKKVHDHSDTVADIRKRIDSDPEGFEDMLYSNLVSFIDTSFSLDYDTKAWWLK